MNAARSYRPHLLQIGCALILVAAGVAVWGRVVDYELLNWDDNRHLTENPHLQSPDWASVARFWEQPFFGLYIPVSYTVFSLERWLDLQLGGAGSDFDPHVYHFGALLLHIANSLLVFRLLSTLVVDTCTSPALRPDADSLTVAPAACLGTLLFLLHPIQTESVAWVSETRGLLAGFFSLLALLGYVRIPLVNQQSADARKAEDGSESSSPQKPTNGVSGTTGRVVREPGGFRYLLAMAAFVLALLAKPSAVAVPLMAAAIDRWILDRPWKFSVARLVPWIGIAVGCIFLNKIEQTDASLPFETSLWQRPFIAGDALAFYLAKLAVPINLCFDYGRSPARVLLSWMAYFTWMVPAVCLVGIFSIRKLFFLRAPLALFIAGVLPVLGLVSFSYQEVSTVADRYLYLSMLGPALAIALLFAARLKLVWILAYCGVVIALGVTSARQASNWRNNQVLFQHGLKVNPRSFVARNNLASELIGLNRLDEAVSLLTRAIELKSDYAEAHYNLGLALARQGKRKSALVHLQRSIELKPEQAAAHYDLAVTLENEGRLDEAEKHYRRALEVQPAYPEALNNLGVLLFAEGDVVQATARFRSALRVQPDFLPALENLAGALIVSGRVREAISHYDTILEIDPDHALAHFNVGRYYLSVGALRRAADHLEMARQFDSSNADAHFNYGVVQGRLRQRELATTAYEAAIQHDPLHPSANLNLGNLYVEQDRLEDARSRYEAALKGALRNRSSGAANGGDGSLTSIIHNNLGEVLFELGEYENAVDQLNAALDLDPDFTAAHFHLARVLHAQGDVDAAVSHLERAIQLAPPNSQAEHDIRTLLKRYRGELDTGNTRDRP